MQAPGGQPGHGAHRERVTRGIAGTGRRDKILRQPQEIRSLSCARTPGTSRAGADVRAQRRLAK